MKISYISGAVALIAAGAASVWGVNEYLSLKAQLKEIQSNSKIVVQAPSSQPEASASPISQTTPQSSPSPSVQVNFDNLPLCDQLDSIAKAGKSVSEFIVNSGRYDEFAAEVAIKCSWNIEQLQIADRILHPPVQTASQGYDLGDQEHNPNWQPTEENESSVANLSVPEANHTPWNNCNGIPEPGESYSTECNSGQKVSNQTGINGSEDERPPWPKGKDYGCEGYDACPTSDEYSPQDEYPPEDSSTTNTDPQISQNETEPQAADSMNQPSDMRSGSLRNYDSP